LSIELDVGYTKAYHRRATARTKLGRLEEARKDYEHLLQLEPQSKLAQAELSKLSELISGVKRVYPVEKRESEKSTKPLVRVKIEEINVESEERTRVEASLNEISKKISLNAKEEELFKLAGSEKPDAAASTRDDSRKKVVEQEVKKELQAAAIVEIPERPMNGYQFKKDWQYLSHSEASLAVYLKKIPPTDYDKLFLNSLESEHLSKMLQVFSSHFIR
jgi:hypothetical protein